MKWSWTVGRIAGITLRVHATFFILLAWLALADYAESRTASAVVIGIAFTLALFASVILHELGHALVARRFGVRTRNITLLPIGGVATLEHMPDDPKQELAIALAGPMVTFVIVVILASVMQVAGYPAVVAQGDMVRGVAGSFVAELMWVNAALLFFNLLPAFPLDGGRVLRALIALRKDHERATEIATHVGRWFALAFAGFGLFYNPFLLLIAMFIWISGTAELEELRRRDFAKGIQVDRLMVRNVATLAPSRTLNDAVRVSLTGFQHDFPVVDNDRVVGILGRHELLIGLAARGGESPVSASMETSFSTTEPDESVIAAMTKSRGMRCQTVPVLSDGKLCGLLTPDKTADFAAITSALRRSAAKIPGRPLVWVSEHSNGTSLIPHQ